MAVNINLLSKRDKIAWLLVAHKWVIYALFLILFWLTEHGMHRIFFYKKQLFLQQVKQVALRKVKEASSHSPDVDPNLVRLFEKNQVWVTFFNQLNQAVRSDRYITHMKLIGKKLYISGYAKSLTSFFNWKNTLPYFSEIRQVTLSEHHSCIEFQVIVSLFS